MSADGAGCAGQGTGVNALDISGGSNSEAEDSDAGVVSDGAIEKEVERVAAAARRAIEDGKRALLGGTEQAKRATKLAKPVKPRSLPPPIPHRPELSPPMLSKLEPLSAPTPTPTHIAEPIAEEQPVQQTLAVLDSVSDLKFYGHDVVWPAASEVIPSDDGIDQRRAQRRRAKECEIEQKVIDMERQYERRIQQRRADAKLADHRASEIRSETEVLQTEKEAREKKSSEELAELRQATKRVEAQAKSRAKALRDSRERSEKATEVARTEARDLSKAREEAMRRERVETVRLKKELAELSQQRVLGTERFAEMNLRLEASEELAHSTERELQEAQQEVAEMRGVSEALEARARGGQAPLTQNAIETRAAASVANRVMRGEEASLRAELSVAEVKNLAFEAEERGVTQRLSYIESEAGALRDALVAAPGTGGWHGGTTARLAEQCNAARSEVAALRDELEHATAATAARAVAAEASDSAERRESAACEELSFVYEQLRSVCVAGRRDLEELAAAIEERQASLSLSRDLETTWVSTWAPADETKSVEELSARILEPSDVAQALDRAVDAHWRAMRELQLQHCSLLLDAELGLCDIEIGQAKIWEGQRKDSGNLRAVREPMQRHREVLASKLEGLRANGNVLQLPQELLSLVEGLRREVHAERMKKGRLESDLHGEEEEAEAAAAKAAALAPELLDMDGLVSEIASLQEERDASEQQCQEILQGIHDSRHDAASRRETQEARASALDCWLHSAEDSLREEATERRLERVQAEAEVVEVEKSVEELEVLVRCAVAEHNVLQLSARSEVETTNRMRERMELLSAVDEEVDAKYRQLGDRAEAAHCACVQEENAVQAKRVELASLQERRAVFEDALRSEARALESASADLAAERIVVADEKRACELEAAQPSQIETGILYVRLELQGEERAAEVLEEEAAAETHGGCQASEILLALRTELEQLREARAIEKGSIDELRVELVQGASISAAPDASVDELVEAMQAQEYVLLEEEAGLLACEERLAAEDEEEELRRHLISSSNVAVDLQRKLAAVKANIARFGPETTLSLADAQISQFGLADIVLAARRERADHTTRLEELALAFEEEMHSESELTAKNTQWAACEAELLALRANAERLAGEADPQHLAMRVSGLRSQVDSGIRDLASARGALAEERARLSPCDSARDSAFPLRGGAAGRRAEADVLEAMAMVARVTSADAEGIAAPGTPHFARQLLATQALLEEQHQREMHALQEHGRVRRLILEEKAREQHAEKLEFERRLESKSSAWGVDRERLVQRVASCDRERERLEHNLSREIRRLESAEAPEEGTAAEGSAGEGGVLPEINASLRETYGFLCHQQRELEEASRERDQLQAHLITTLERVSRQHAGLTPEPPASALAALSRSP